MKFLGPEIQVLIKKMSPPLLSFPCRDALTGLVPAGGRMSALFFFYCPILFFTIIYCVKSVLSISPKNLKTKNFTYDTN
jgi:hypothetical protein